MRCVFIAVVQDDEICLELVVYDITGGTDLRQDYVLRCLCEILTH